MKDIITRIILLNCYLLHVMKKLAINSMILIVILPVSLWSQLLFVEDFSDGTEPAGWTFPSNWQVGSVGYGGHPIGNPSPAAFFYWNPPVQNYSERMTSPMISVGQAQQVQVFFDMELDFYSPGPGIEGLAIEYQTSSGSWIEALSYEVAAGSSVEYPLSTQAYIASVTDSIQLGFRAYGLNSFNINSWDIDNIRVENILPATQLGSDIDGEAAGDYSGCSVSMNSAGDRVAIGAWKNSGYTGHVRIYEYINGSWTQLGSDIDAEAVGDYSGISVSMNSAGNRVAIGAINNDGTGINAGHVRVYEYSNSSWTQLGSDIDGEAADDRSGRSVSIDYDGDRVAIGAYQNDGTGDNAGHVRVYEYSNSSWTQLGSDIDGEAADDQSGWSVSINSAGDRVAIGAWRNDGTGGEAGHVRVYEYSNSSWTQLGSDIDGEAAGDYSGYSVSINSAGDVVAIGAYENDGTGSDAGHVRVYEYSSGSWTQFGSDIDSEAAFDRSGRSVSMNSAGNRVAIGADGNSGTGSEAGHVRVYEYSNSSWTQLGGDMDGEAAGDYSGYSVSMDSDGDRVAIGAFYNDGTGSDAGHVRVYSLANPVQTVQTTTYVPDDNFEQALIDLGLDDVLNDSVLTANISGVTTLNVNNDSISDLTGIEDFTALTELRCSANQITSLDVSNNTALTFLSCTNNQLTSLDVSNSTALTHLYCYANQLTSLDVNGNTALSMLNCQTNQLTALDVSNNTGLTRLLCNFNQLTALDVSNNTALTYLICNFNQLTSLDVSNNTALTYFRCDYNQLTSLDVSANAALQTLYVHNTGLTALDLSSNPALTYLNASNTGLTALDLSSNPALTYLNASNTGLTALDLSSNPALTTLYCYSNQLTYLNMRNGVTDALTAFNATNNDSLECIETLDPDYATANWTYENGNIDDGVTFSEICSGNPNDTYVPDDNFEQALIDLGYDDVLDDYVVTDSINSVTFLDVSNDSISDLTGIEDFIALTTLWCYGNYQASGVLTSLDVSSNTALTELNCSYNQLDSLDVSNNTALTRLECQSNSIDSLDVSNNTALTHLDCGINWFVGGARCKQ